MAPKIKRNRFFFLKNHFFTNDFQIFASFIDVEALSETCTIMTWMPQRTIISSFSETLKYVVKGGLFLNEHSTSKIRECKKTFLSRRMGYL